MFPAYHPTQAHLSATFPAYHPMQSTSTLRATFPAYHPLQAHLHAMFAAEPCLAAVLADSLDPDATTHAAAHAAAQHAAS